MENTSTPIHPRRLLRGVTRTVTLSIYEGDGETPLDLRGIELRVVVMRDCSNDIYVPDVSVSGEGHNEVVFIWPAERQTCGRHTIDLQGDFGASGVSRTNWHGPNGIELVEWTEQTTSGEVANLAVEELELSGTLETAPSAGGAVAQDAVLYTEQTLTAEQQAQARTNIGAGTYTKPASGIPDSDMASGAIPQVFVGQYGVTTVAEVAAAINASKVVLIIRDGEAFMLNDIIVGNYYFGAIYGQCSYRLVLLSTDEWREIDPVVLEKTSNLVTEFGETPLDTRYPSEKLVKDSLDAKGNKTTIEISLPYELVPNKLYAISGALTGPRAIRLATPADATIENEYKLTFDTDSTAPDITWPASVTKWSGNCLSNGQPALIASHHYEVSILNGYGIIVEF